MFRIERRIKHLSDEERLRERQEKTVPLLTKFKAWLNQAVHTGLPKDTFGIAVNYALKHWDALTNFTKAGHLDASNNFAERCMRSVAIGRKAFLFVGSERAGHAAAIYYSLVESCLCRIRHRQLHAERQTMPNRIFHRPISQGFATV